MVQTAQASVPDRFAATSAQRDRIQNTSDHRFANSRAGNGAGHRHSLRHTIIHQIADRSVVLRRLSARRRLARIDPEAIERRAWRIIVGLVRAPSIEAG